MATVNSSPDGDTRLPISGLYLPALGNSIGAPIEINGLQVTRGVNSHESAVLSMQLDTRVSETLTDSPIRFRFGAAPNRSEFFGHVFDVEKDQPFQQITQTTVRCIGATKKLKSPPETPVFLSNRTAVSAIREALRGTGLGLSTSKREQSWVLPRFSLGPGNSRWAYVNSLAQSMGASLYAFDGTVWVFNTVMELEAGASAMTFTKSLSITDARELVNFSASSFRGVDVNTNGVRFGYFDQTGEARTYLTRGSDPEDAEWDSSIYLPPIGGDNTLRMIKDLDSVRYEGMQQARALIKGVATVTPGMVIGIVTGEVKHLRDSWDGLWLVSSVTHSMSKSEFTSTLDLVRDKYRRDLSPGGYVPFWVRNGTPQPSLRESNGEWVSVRGAA